VDGTEWCLSPLGAAEVETGRIVTVQQVPLGLGPSQLLPPAHTPPWEGGFLASLSARSSAAFWLVTWRSWTLPSDSATLSAW
jgi:hypothetical protein